jgi:hypothetical protein
MIALVVTLLFADTAVEEIATQAYIVAIPARSHQFDSQRFVHACKRSQLCRVDCAETLEWMEKRWPDSLTLDAFLGKKSAPAQKPMRLCADAEKAGSSKEQLSAWVRQRFIQAAVHARPAADERAANRLDCALGRLQNKTAAEACRRAEAPWAARMVHEVMGVDRSMLPLLMFKGCEELDGCAGECREELFELATVIPKPPKSSQCELPRAQKGEAGEAWRQRIAKDAWSRLAGYYRDLVLPKLGVWERWKLACDLAKINLGPPVLSCP